MLTWIYFPMSIRLLMERDFVPDVRPCLVNRLYLSGRVDLFVLCSTKPSILD